MHVNLFYNITCTMHVEKKTKDKYEIISCRQSHAMNLFDLHLILQMWCFIIFVIVWETCACWLAQMSCMVQDISLFASYHVWYIYYRLSRVAKYLSIGSDIMPSMKYYWLAHVSCLVHILILIGSGTTHDTCLTVLLYVGSISESDLLLCFVVAKSWSMSDQKLFKYWDGSCNNYGWCLKNQVWLVVTLWIMYLWTLKSG